MDRAFEIAVNDMTKVLNTLESIQAEIDDHRVSYAEDLDDDLSYMHAQLMDLREELIDVSGLNVLHRMKT